MKVLYLGPNMMTSALRVAAFRRAGHDVQVINPMDLLPDVRWMGTWVWRTGGLWVDALVAQSLFRILENQRYGSIFVDPGNLLSRKAVRRLRQYAPILINYNLDNPFVARDGQRWRAANAAIPEYDVVVTPRLSCIEPAYRHGARLAVRMFQCADEERDRPRELSDHERRRFSSEVCFVGTWMPERGAFLAELIRRGVPLRIYGTGWHKAQEYLVLKANLCEGHLDGADYSAALLGAKIVLGMLSAGNEDLHTTRSVEAPSMGAILCAPRTSDHLELYVEGREAVFYGSVEECAEVCADLLKDTARQKKIMASARARALSNGNFNQTILDRVVEAVLAQGESRSRLGG